MSLKGFKNFSPCTVTVVTMDCFCSRVSLPLVAGANGHAMATPLNPLVYQDHVPDLVKEAQRQEN